ncbi:MAG: cupin domain-containing protein [Pseudomonadota bacterium]
MSEIKVEKATPERLKKLGVDSWSPWGCGVETFDWEYSDDETAYVKEGKVRVLTEYGQEVEFGKGDLVFFPKGLKCTWTVIEPIKKVFTFG